MDKMKEKPLQRPYLLAVLCVLTFIGSGVSFFSNTVIYVFYDQFNAFFQEHPVLDWMGTKMDMSFFSQLHPLFFLSQGIMAVVAILGAWFMWNYRKIGFHLYASSQIILLIIPKLFMPDLPFPTLQLMISAFFVFFYYKFLPIMD